MSMQKILNSRERNQAFLKFLFFFLLTVILVVTAVYFNFRLPLKENNRLQEQIAVQREEYRNQEKFADNMDKALVLLDSLDTNTKNTDQVAMLLQGKIEDLFKLQQKGNSPYARLNHAIAYRLPDIKNQKLQLLKLSEKANTLRNLEEKLQYTEGQLSEKQKEVDQLRKGAGF